MTPPADSSKRRTLRVLVSTTGCVAFGLVAVPAAGLLLGSSKDATPTDVEWIPLALAFAELESRKPRRVLIQTGEARAAVWLMRDGHELRALSARCPHLGCSVALAPDASSFDCPCHGARFSLVGQRLNPDHNPALRDMDPLEARIDPSTGRVEVQLRRFLPGIAERLVQEAGSD